MTAFEEKYRKRNPAEVASVPAAMDVSKAAAQDEYKVCNISNHPEFDLWIRTNDTNKFADVALPYSCRNHMISDGSGFMISMHYNTPVICVTLHGRNLQDLFRKLLKHEVEWVMEFDARKWETPADDAPCITGIEVSHKPLPEKGDDALPGEKNGPVKPATH